MVEWATCNEFCDLHASCRVQGPTCQQKRSLLCYSHSAADVLQDALQHKDASLHTHTPAARWLQNIVMVTGSHQPIARVHGHATTSCASSVWTHLWLVDRHAAKAKVDRRIATFQKSK